MLQLPAKCTRFSKPFLYSRGLKQRKEMSSKFANLCLVALRLVVVAGLLLLPASCDKDELSCAEIEAQLDRALRDLQVAVLSADCPKIAPLFNRSIKLVRQGKNCEYVQNLVADEGYASVEEFVEFLESERDRVLDALSC
jgi:hypothetical protein